MMNALPYRKCLTGLLLFLLSTTNAQALNAFELKLIGGLAIMDDYGLADIDPGFGWQVQTMFFLHPRLSMGPGYFQTRSSSIVGEDAFIRSLRLNTQVQFTDQPLSPFALIHVGYQWVDLVQIDSANGFEWGASVGARYALDETMRFELGIDLTQTYLTDPIDQLQNNWFFYLGASIAFGSLSPSSPSMVSTNPHALCHNVPKGVAVDGSGCPLDTDGDGVPDYMDLCPATDTKKVDSMGCPNEHFARGMITGVDFEEGSARLKSSSVQTLERIARALAKFPALHFNIEGHTDSTGDSLDNQKLSQARAQVVTNVLIEKGLDATRIKAIGFGQNYPIAPNTSKEGRSLNRRIEIKWQNKPTP